MAKNFSIIDSDDVLSLIKKIMKEKNIDPKTIYHLYLYENNIINLQYKTNNISIPKIESLKISIILIFHIYTGDYIYIKEIFYMKL